MARQGIFSRSFWQSYWVALRRSPHDKRDRKVALRITLALLLFFGIYGTYIVWIVRHVFNSPGEWYIFAPGLLVLVVVITYSRISERKDRLANDKADLAAVDPALRARLAQDAYTLAVLLTRAGSEHALKEKELPENRVAITRQIQMEKLRQLGKFATLPPSVRDLLLLPDGHWTEDQMLSVRKCFEIMRCLRWVLGEEPILTPLTQVPKLNFKDAQRLFESPQKILEGNRLLPNWDIRVERNNADFFFGRCFAEALGRGLISNQNPDIQAWAANVNQSMRENHVRDVLAGVQTIAEVQEAGLMYLAWTSQHRYTCLRLLMDLQDGKDRWAEWDQLCFPQAPPKSDASPALS